MAWAPEASDGIGLHETAQVSALRSKRIVQQFAATTVCPSRKQEVRFAIQAEHELRTEARCLQPANFSNGSACTIRDNHGLCRSASSSRWTWGCQRNRGSTRRGQRRSPRLAANASRRALDKFESEQQEKWQCRSLLHGRHGASG